MTSKQRFLKAKNYIAKQINSAGFYCESGNDLSGISISLTRLGLSGIYAEITPDEINYFLENTDEETLQEVMEAEQ